MTMEQWLHLSAARLREAGITSAYLDAELLLAHTIRRSRTWIHAHAYETLDPRRRDIADARVDLRAERVPLAYIIGHKEFYGRRFAVTPQVLVPRPESEALIARLLELTPNQTPARLIDVGTGSGCLAITAKLERPALSVIGSDLSSEALAVARQNAQQLNADVTVVQQNLLDDQLGSFDFIIANLPYVDPAWDDLSPELAHEPAEALFADQEGLALIFKLATQARAQLNPGGHLLLEADPTQHDAIAQRVATTGAFTENARIGYCLDLIRL